MSTEKIDREAANLIGLFRSGGKIPPMSSASIRRLGARYRKAHPQFTRNGQYSDEVYKTANEIYAIAEGVARAEKANRRMKRKGLI